MTKKLVREYVTYGKGDGEELSEEYVIEDIAERRREIIEDFGYYDYAFDCEESFINGKIDSFQIDSGGGDWDEPTGRFVAIYDKDEIIAGIKESRDSEIARVESLFGKGGD